MLRNTQAPYTDPDSHWSALNKPQLRWPLLLVINALITAALGERLG